MHRRTNNAQIRRNAAPKCAGYQMPSAKNTQPGRRRPTDDANGEPYMGRSAEEAGVLLSSASPSALEKRPCPEEKTCSRKATSARVTQEATRLSGRKRSTRPHSGGSTQA